MPLSDREQRILSDIEAQLHADDPKLASTVSNTTVSSVTRRQVKLSIAGLILGFVMLLAFSVYLWVAFAGFFVMLASAVYGADRVKRLGGEAGEKLSNQLREGVDRYMQDRRDRGKEG